MGMYDELGDEDRDYDSGPGLPPMRTTPVPGATDWEKVGIKPPPLRPLRYCDFRDDSGLCLRFSSLELDTMAFCTYHHQEVSMALAEEERRIS